MDIEDPAYGTVAAGHVPSILYHGTRADLRIGDLLRGGPKVTVGAGTDAPAVADRAE